MAAYFVKVNYWYDRRSDIHYNGECIITYEKFERVDEESFRKKVKDKFTTAEVIKITDIVKL